MQTGDKQKWELAFEKHKQWDEKKARKIQKKEAKIIINWLKKLQLPKYQILEIGCGNGYLGMIIITEFLKQNISFTYHFTDLLPQYINLSKKNLKKLSMHNEIKFDLLDIYEADKTLGKNSQDIIISTGFASAATYQKAIPIVSKILKPNGILICDFVNHLSPFLFISQLPYSFVNLLKTIKHGKNNNSYHFGRIGIKEYFESNKLKKAKVKTLTLRRNPLIYMFKKIGDVS